VARRAIVVLVALAAADSFLAAAGRGRARWLTKPLLMPVLMAGRGRPAQQALALGGVGDVALPGSGEAAFTAGLVSFLAGHVAWIIALRQRPGGVRVAGDDGHPPARGLRGRSQPGRIQQDRKRPQRTRPGRSSALSGVAAPVRPSVVAVALAAVAGAVKAEDPVRSPSR